MTMTPSKKNPSESLNKVMSHITPAEKGNGISGTLGSLRRGRKATEICSRHEVLGTGSC